MAELTKYLKKTASQVVAVQLDLETDGFTYQKWGGTQRCKPGDWLVDNRGDVYTIDADTFARTYEELSPGVYEKVAPVWARQATEGGAIATKEGSTRYEPGDYLVFNDPERQDGYAMSEEKFGSLYELAD